MNLNSPPDSGAPGRTDDRETLTLAQAAARLRLPQATLITALRRGLVEGFQGPDGDWRVILGEAPAAGEKPTSPPNNGAPLASDDAVARLGAAIDSLKEDFSRLDTTRPAVAEQPFGADPPPAEPAAPDRVESQPHVGSDIAELSASIHRLLAAEDEPEPPASGDAGDEIAYWRREVRRRDRIIEDKDKLIAKLARRVARNSDRLADLLPGEATMMAQVESVQAGFRATTTGRDRELEIVRDLLAALHAVLAERPSGRKRRNKG